MPVMSESVETSWLAVAVSQLRSAAPHVPECEHQLTIAGQGVRIRYADANLAEILGRATRHLRRADPGTPALTIDCWSEPGPPISLPTNAPKVGTTHVDDGNLVLNWDAPNGQLVAFDRQRRHAWAQFNSLAPLPTWEPTTPFRRILHWWAADNGMQLAHAAAVGRAEGGVLLVGRSGSGKSTTSLACLEAGLDFAGDDGCLLAAGDPPQVHGLYVSAKGDAKTAALLPGCREEFEQSPLTIDGESVLFADRIYPHRISAGFPLMGVVVLRLGGPSSRLSPLTPAAGLRALAPSTILQMPGNRAGGLARLAATVRGLLVWELTLGPDPATAAALIQELLDGPDRT
jgi:hypothetical protein